jgi:hypothetical protein
MSAPYVPSILIDDVIEALASFLGPFVGATGTPVGSSGTPIIRGQNNRTPMPVPAFVKLQEVLQHALAVPIFTNNPDLNVQQATITGLNQIDVQIDFYGPSAADWSTAVETVFRSPYAADQFPPGIAPLYCSDGRQAQLVTGEEQYENRWIITASLEYNPDVIIAQQSAVTLKPNVFEDLP